MTTKEQQRYLLNESCDSQDADLKQAWPYITYRLGIEIGRGKFIGSASEFVEWLSVNYPRQLIDEDWGKIAKYPTELSPGTTRYVTDT